MWNSRSSFPSHRFARAEIPLHPSPCPLPTDLLYTALFTTEKTPISQIPDADRSLARGRPKMADRLPF